MADGPQIFGIGQDTAQVVSGSGLAAGAHLYLSPFKGVWRAIFAAGLIVGGGWAFGDDMHAVLPSLSLQVCGAAAGAIWLGVFAGLKKWADKIDVSAWLKRGQA